MENGVKLLNCRQNLFHSFFSSQCSLPVLYLISNKVSPQCMSWFLFHFYYRCICALKMHVFQLSTKQNYTTLVYRILNRENRDATHRQRCDCGVFKLSSVLCVWNTVTKELISYTCNRSR